MKTVVLGRPPAELTAVIERRRALGLDTYDEVWDGDYHMAPAGSGRHGEIQMLVGHTMYQRLSSTGLRITGPVNVGSPDDFRVPDAAVVRSSDGLWFPTAELVVEVVSPDDETYAKFGFYARHEVAELLVVDPTTTRVELYQRSSSGDAYEPVTTSRLLKMTAGEIRDALVRE